MPKTEGKLSEIPGNTAETPAKSIPKRRGPKPKLTEDKALEIIGRIEGGESLKEACHAVGQSLSGWRRGLAALAKANPDLRTQYDRAIAANRESMKDEAIQTIRDAFATDWRAGAWWLERAYPEEFGRRQLELGGIDGKPISVENTGSVDVSGLTVSQIAALRNILDPSDSTKS